MTEPATVLVTTSEHPLRSRLRVLALWLLVLGIGTAAMLPFRARLDKAHVALLLLLVPLGGSAAGGRSIGLGLAAASFLVFNWCASSCEAACPEPGCQPNRGLARLHR